MAAQLFRAACRAEPEIVPCSGGRTSFGPLHSWLRTHVHAKGSLLTTEELLVAVTGRAFSKRGCSALTLKSAMWSKSRLRCHTAVRSPAVKFA